MTTDHLLHKSRRVMRLEKKIQKLDHDEIVHLQQMTSYLLREAERQKGIEEDLGLDFIPAPAPTEAVKHFRETLDKAKREYHLTPDPMLVQDNEHREPKNSSG